MCETNHTNDISGLQNITELYKSSILKKWIKLIPIDKTLPFNDYNRRGYFIPIADIVLDNELHTSGIKQGNKKRDTLIQFVPTISTKAFKIEKHNVTFIMAILAIFTAAIFLMPWIIIPIFSLVYLISIPFSWFHYTKKSVLINVIDEPKD